MENVHTTRTREATELMRQTLVNGVESGEITQIAILIDDQCFYVPLTNSLAYAATLLYAIHLDTAATRPTTHDKED